MRYEITMLDGGEWAIAAYTAEGKLGATVYVRSTSEAMRVFFLLAGEVKHFEDTLVNIEDYAKDDEAA